MAEAVASLALASSILQVIDFGTKVVSTASKVYQASKRKEPSLNELEMIYKNLVSTLDTIETDDTEMVDNGVLGMKSLAKGCSDLAKELLDTWHKIGFDKEVKTKHQALWVALKHVWKDEKIRSLQARLDEFRSQLTMCLLVSLRQYAGQSLSKQGEILEKLGKSKDGPFGTSVLEYVTSKLNNASSQFRHMKFLEADLIKAIKDQESISGENSNPHKVETTQKICEKSIGLFLRSLEYPRMHNREEEIPDAHERTFKWIFQKNSDEWVSLGQWLESNDSLYWITGKAGSGKSTMMRYISHLFPFRNQKLPRSRSHAYLQRWAGSKKLIVASFYFYTGDEAQTTQRGLFMTLLREIFHQCPDLLPLASPGKWENVCLFGMSPDWTDLELKRLLLQCIESLGCLDAKMALFVDGLDEFGGDPKVLISMLEDIQKLPHHKLCVASRPWNEFRDAFDQKPSLMVEHFTRDDMKNFVIARFESDHRFVQLHSRERDFADQLAENIVSKSSGVFLWVSLVVSSLISSMGNGDRIADFQRRLDQLPSELSLLYRKMIRSLEPFYLDHTAQLFALVRASRKPMNLLLASYVDEEDPKVALEMEHTPIANQDAQVRMEAMRRRINSRSKGLIEIRGGTSTPQGFVYKAANHTKVRVQYLHRTVKDFVEKDREVQRIFAGALKSFDPYVMLLAGHLAYMKRTPGPSARPATLETYGELFSHARRVHTQNVDAMIHILDSLDKLFPLDWIGWIDTRRNVHVFGRTFLSLATAHNVTEYVRARATGPCLIRHPDGQQWPLLIDALTFTHRGDKLVRIEDAEGSPSVRGNFKATIEVLLDKGVDPRFTVECIRPGARWTSNRPSTSPLARAAVGYMDTKHELYLLAIELLAKDAKFDSSTLTYTLHEYLPMRNQDRYSGKWANLSIWSWYLVKKSLREALRSTAQGNPPNFDIFWANLMAKY